MMTTKEKLSNIALIIGMFIAAGSIAPQKAKAIPIETSNSPIFKQDWTGTVGADVNSNRPAVNTRKYDINKDNLFIVNEPVTVRKDGVLISKKDHRPVVLLDSKDNFVIKQLIDNKYQNVALTKHQLALADDGKTILDVHPAGGLITGLANDVFSSCNGGQLVGQNCQTKSVYTDITGFVQGGVLLGDNTAGFGGYDSNGKTIYGGLALKLDQLTVTGGGDRQGLTASAAYSIGSLSPFYAYQRGVSNYGLDYRLSDNFSVNGGYRGDNSYFLGARVDVGGNFDKPQPVAKQAAIVPVQESPPIPDLICESGYRKFMNTCVKLIKPIARPASKYIRGLGGLPSNSNG